MMDSMENRKKQGHGKQGKRRGFRGYEVDTKLTDFADSSSTKLPSRVRKNVKIKQDICHHVHLGAESSVPGTSRRAQEDLPWDEKDWQMYFEDEEIENELAIFSSQASSTGTSTTSTRKGKKPKLTHFVSIPLNSKAFMEKFGEFKEKILSHCSHCKGVEDNLFQVPEKLHLTITVLRLRNEQEIEAAQDILERCKIDIVSRLLEGSPLLIDIGGLACMNSKPSKTYILYAKVRMQDRSDKLQKVADGIRAEFAATNLCPDKHRNRPVKLHSTLMNSSFLSEDARHPYDATEILELFGEFYFTEHLIDSIHISEFRSCGEDGFYVPAGKVSL